MPLITPITDRTASDVAYALEHQSDATDLKGSLNVSDLNRIENNTVFLRDTLASYGYVANITTHAQWTTSSFFYTTDIDRIKQNLNNILAVYRKLPTTPVLSLEDYDLDYNDINNVEKVIKDINNIMECMTATFLYTGQFYTSTDYNIQLFG